MRILAAILAGFLAVVVLLSLATALTSATANLANGVAFATASTALLTSQCITGFMVLVAIIAGVGVGFGVANFLAIRRAAKQSQWISPLPQSGIQHSFHQEQPMAGYLPDPGARLPSLYLPVEQSMQPEEAEDTLFRNWGW
ncbi:MAG: hypothetical protein AB1894_15405 [Chloroflexota bacterium]